jgi:hypothetical protein
VGASSRAATDFSYGEESALYFLARKGAEGGRNLPLPCNLSLELRACKLEYGDDERVTDPVPA